MKLYLVVFSLFLSISGFAISKCLNEVKSVCPKYSERSTCLAENASKFSAECSETLKQLMGPTAAASAQTPTTTTTTLPPEPPPAMQPPTPPTEGVQGFAKQIDPPPAKIESNRKHACADDVEKFCAAAKGGRTQLESCMKANLQNLSPECSTLGQAQIVQQNGTGVNIQNVRFQPRKKDPGEVACEKDQAVVCPNLKGNKASQCMMDNLGRLSTECRTMLGNLANLKSQFDKGKVACAADLQKFCPNANDRQKKSECMIAHQKELSPDCMASGGVFE